MKKNILYIATIFLIYVASASQLNLNLNQYGTYQVFLNGASYTIQDNFINFSKLASGNHHLKIVKHINTGYGVSLQKVICNSTINVPFRSSVYASLYSPYQLSVTDIIYHQKVRTQHYCVNSCRHHHRHNYRYNSCNNVHYKNNGHNGHYKNNGHNGHYKNNGHNGYYKNNGHNGYYKNNGHNGQKNTNSNFNYNNNKNNSNVNNGNYNKNNNGQKKTNGNVNYKNNKNNNNQKKTNRNGNTTRRS